jgi:5-methylcytosine-specific restriction protein A
MVDLEDPVSVLLALDVACRRFGRDVQAVRVLPVECGPDPRAVAASACGRPRSWSTSRSVPRSTTTSSGRPCLRPGCGELVETGYCEAHAPDRRGLQLDATTRGYGHRWQLLARRYRQAHPVCERCGLRPSVLVHHVDGLGPLGPAGFDVGNLEAVCRYCHTHAHRRLREAGVRVGVECAAPGRGGRGPGVVGVRVGAGA